MSQRFAAGLLLVACSNCSAPRACDESALFYDNEGTRLASAFSQGTLRLSDAGETAELRFRGSLAGLPELWPGDSAILFGSAELELSLTYESEPHGSDGRTEMPSVGVTFVPGGPRTSEPLQTPRFPDAQGSAFSSSFFETCSDDGAGNCCLYGAPECSLSLRVILTRIDGAPFPPVAVEWRASAQANVSTCPLGGDTPVLTFEDSDS